MKIQRSPRHFLGELNSLHRHPGVPEKQNVKTRNKNVVGIMALEIPRLFRPAERGKGPQGRAEPCIEDVLVLPERTVIAGLDARFLYRVCDKDFALFVEPGRDPMAPPQLARDTPGLDVLEPVIPGLGPAFGNDPDCTRAGCFDDRLYQCRGVDIPLIGKPWLDHHTRPVAIGGGDRSILDLDQCTFGFE